MMMSFLGYTQQENTVKRYYVKFASEDVAPKFVKEGEKFTYIGDDKEEEAFFAKYDIHNFEQVYPTSRRINLRNAFFLETSSQDLVSELMKAYPTKYRVIEDLTDEKMELNNNPYFPNDYVVSPVRIPFDLSTFDRKELEYIGAPKAWGITNSLNNTITIGLSDAKVDDQDPDLAGKVSFLPNGYSYGNLTPDCDNGFSTHGTGVGAIAAAQGDNGYGTVGVCYDCDILAANAFSYGHLLTLAQSGVKVINMSWGGTSSLPPDQYIQSSQHRQDIQESINEIVEDYGVVLVASGGNNLNFNANGYFPLYNYPASFDNVISVSGVNHWYDMDNPHEVTAIPGTTNQSYLWRIEDSVSQLVLDDGINEPQGVYTNYWNPNGSGILTLNDQIDILAPGYQVHLYATHIYNCPVDHNNDGQLNYLLEGKYGNATSPAAPYVTGTVALMFMVNECLTPKEVENILKLTAKDIENTHLNAPFYGLIGSGKLETGNAVEFVDEMQKYDGLAVIKNHRFHRYDFNLDKFNNDLLIENVQFEENTTVDFTARNSIELTEGTSLKPGANGYVILNTDTTINDICVPSNVSTSASSSETSRNTSSELESELILYPNPTRDIVQLQLVSQNDKIASVEIYNIHGHLISEVTALENNSLNISAFKKGIYLIKVHTVNKNSFTEKVIKM